MGANINRFFRSKTSKVLLAGTGVVVLAIVALASFRPDLLSFEGHAYAADCDVDSEIAASDRKEIEGLAVQFVRQVLANQADIAFAELSPESQQVTQIDKFREAVRVIRADGPYGPTVVTRTHLVGLRWGRGHGETLDCFNNKDLGGGDPVKIGSERRQAQVVVVTSNAKGSQSFTVWMHADADDWRIGGFHFQPATHGSKDSVRAK